MRYVIKWRSVIHNSEWTCTGISHNILQKSFASQDISVTIRPDYKFIVKIGDYRLDDCSSIPTTEVTSLSLIMELLGIIDNSSLCEGNPDTKFESAQKRQNGKFLSNSFRYELTCKQCVNLNCIYRWCFSSIIMTQDCYHFQQSGTVAVLFLFQRVLNIVVHMKSTVI